MVDDIAEQRDVASALLEKLGYRVHSVSSGEKAVEYLKGNKVDILILDMIMAPGIDGFETYRRILEIHPKQKAVIVSGFSETDRVREAQKLGAGPYIKNLMCWKRSAQPYGMNWPNRTQINISYPAVLVLQPFNIVFTKIRARLHFNDNEITCGIVSSDDALLPVRTFIACPLERG